MPSTIRTLMIGAACILPLLSSPAPAVAATTSVQGTESFTKLVLDNQQKAVVIKMFAPGGKGKVRWLNATVRDKDGTRYKAAGGWYSDKWIVSVEKGEAVVACDGYKLTYNTDKGFWRAVLPRPCLKDLANRVKVTYAEVVDQSPTPGSAGPTKYVARG